MEIVGPATASGTGVAPGALLRSRRFLMRARSAVLAVSFLAAVVGSAALPGCNGPRRPPAPRPDRDPLALLAAAEGPAPTLADLLAKYPLGTQPMRADLVAVTRDYSAFLVQTRRGVAPHFHRSHVERTWVLAGGGTCYIDTRSYPAVPGSAFRIEAGLNHRVDQTSEEPLVALVVYEPPMASMDEDRVKVGD